MNSRPIFYHSGDSLDIRPRLAEIVAVTMIGGTILWDRDGMVHEVPNVILRSTLSIHQSYLKMLEARPNTQAPLHSHHIYWEQTRETKKL